MIAKDVEKNERHFRQEEGMLYVGGRGRRRGPPTRVKRKIKIRPSIPLWVVGSIKGQRERINDGSHML